MVIQQDKMQSLATRMSQDEVKGRSPWADARKRFLRNKAAMTGLIILIGVALFALLLMPDAYFERVQSIA